ncbi:MAG: translation initiation factor IF-2 N-terminal domain-containing protein, partial [Fibrobacter sp.]|nr:translation initiation factor IF-2 N-terminal domain-containing protein [Fibrobacter sp.]
MSIEEQIKPVDWAKEHGVKSELVMKLLRDNGVKVLTQVSKVNASDFEKIEAAVAEEKKKQDARSKNLKKASSSDAESSTEKKKSTTTSTTKDGVKISLKKATTTKKATAKPAATKAAAKPAATEAPAAAPASAPAAPAAPAKAEAPKVETPAAPKPVEAPAAPEAPKAAPAPEKPAAAPEKPVAAPAPEPAVKPDPKPVAAAPAAPTMMTADTELKQPPMKAQVFKPDAAILARIAKSQQQQQGGRGPGGNRRPGPGGRGPGNAQGYTGSFGPRSSGTGDNRGNGQRRPGQGGASSSRGGYTGRNGGFSSGSMQEAFNASAPGMGSQNAGKGGNSAKGQNGRHGNDKNRRGNSRDRQEQQKEQQQEMVRQNVSRVMADLSKKPVKKVYRKEHNDNDSGEEKKILKTSDFITVGELAGLMDQMPARVIAKCMEMGMMVTINARLDFETIQILADEFGYEAQLMEEYEEEALGVEEESQENLKPRHPVVTVMGHVDHGKTSLLDWIRKTHVVSGESGGITQHIGAYEVTTAQGKVTFLDTPGHEAFSAMRARGSQVTDVIVLVVAADSMVMPQTVECIELAKREKVPMVVAITKIDLPTANPDKIRAQLAERGVEVEQWGGQTSCVEVSARTGQGMDQLLETLA